MITNDRHKLKKFKQKSISIQSSLSSSILTLLSFNHNIIMSVFVLITILMNLPSSVYCNNNNKSIDETSAEVAYIYESSAETDLTAAESSQSSSLLLSTATTEEYQNNNNMKMHRIQTPEGLEHRSLEAEYSPLEMEHRSIDNYEPAEQQPIITPRVEYNSWQPVGRGDPLKNDPTYDYSPPVVEPVRYWAENTKNENLKANSLTDNKEVTHNKDKNEILMLGIPAKRQNYRKESKYNGHETMPSSESVYKQQYYSAENHQNSHPPNLQGTIRRSYSYLPTYHNLPTRLMPPPMQTIAPPSTVTHQNGNKMMPTTESYYHTYHHHYSVIPSTSKTHTTSNIIPGVKPNENNNGAYFHYNSLSASKPSSNWIYNKIPFDTRNAESMNYMSITNPETNGIQASPSSPSSSVLNIKQQPYFKRKPWIHELLSKEITKSPPLFDGTNYVSHIPSKIPLSPSLPPPQPQQPQPSSSLPPQKPNVQSPSQSQYYIHHHHHQPMNTLKPAMVKDNVSNGFVPMITTQEPIKTTTLFMVSSTTPSKPTTLSSTVSTTFEPTMVTKPSPTYTHSTTNPPKQTTTMFTTKSTTTSTTSTTTKKLNTLKPKPTQYTTMFKKIQKITTPKNELTTDALFSHYKQPQKPIFGPLYVIIEGHSKVKNYGLKDNDTKIVHQPKIVPIEMSNKDAVVKKHVVLKDEHGQEIEIKHLHTKKTNTEKKEEEDKTKILQYNKIEKDSAEPLSLLSFLDSSLGGLFGVADSSKQQQKNITNQSTTTVKPTTTTITTTTTTKAKSKYIENSPMIFVTTMKPFKDLINNKNNAVTKTDIIKPIESALIQESKETRQIFDYDQYREKPAASSIFDFFNTGEDYSDYEEAARDSEHTLNEREILSAESLEESNEENMELNTSEIRMRS